jgi:hypothetical protein
VKLKDNCYIITALVNVPTLLVEIKRTLKPISIPVWEESIIITD